MQYYLTDIRGVLVGGPFKIQNAKAALPLGAVVASQEPPIALSGEVIIHAGNGLWISAPEPEFPAGKPIDITPFRLLFDLMHPIEQLFLASLFREARALTPSEMIDPAMTDRTAALVRLDNAYERIERLVNWENRGFFNIIGPEALGFLDACRALKVFGPDDDNTWPGSEAAATARIAAIRANKPYPQA